MQGPNLNLSPFQRYLGVKLVSHEPGVVKMQISIRDDLLRQDGSDWIHGGVLSALVDIAGAYAVFTKKGSGSSTADLRIDYLRPATGRTLSIVGMTRKIGRTVSIADIEIYDEQNTLLVVGRGSYIEALTGLDIVKVEHT